MLLEIHEMREILARTSYKNWAIACYLGHHEGPHLHIRAQVQDAFKPIGQTQVLDIHCRIPRVARRDEEHFLDFLLERLQVAENHETREFFKVDRKVYNSPHKEFASRDLD